MVIEAISVGTSWHISDNNLLDLSKRGCVLSLT